MFAMPPLHFFMAPVTIMILDSVHLQPIFSNPLFQLPLLGLRHQHLPEPTTPSSQYLQL